MRWRTWRTAFMGSLGLAVAPVAFAATACFPSNDKEAAAPDAADAASNCPSEVPADCPAVIPSWSTEVEAIIDQRCNQCHADGGVEASKHAFDTYAHVYAQRTSILGQVVPCKMPPDDAGALSTEERAALLGWLVCHAPNN